MLLSIVFVLYTLLIAIIDHTYIIDLLWGQSDSSIYRNPLLPISKTN